MRLLLCFNTLALLATLATSESIWDAWQTTWDRSQLYTPLPFPTPINFVEGCPNGTVIAVDDTQKFQKVSGFGGALTDSSALVLNNLKTKNPTAYWALLNTLFNPNDGARAAGLNNIRVSLGASDFSATAYSFADQAGDLSLKAFNINRAPDYLFSVLRDIQSINKILQVHLAPWSPPGWMKNSGTMNGGSLKSELVNEYALYLLKCLQGFQEKGIPAFSIAVQNEPLHEDRSYPTSKLTPQMEVKIAKALRTLMNKNGFSKVKLIGFNHNWDRPDYAVQLMDQAADTFDGVGFHCYAGYVGQQSTFSSRYPDKDIHFTECSGTVGSDAWSDIKWYMDNLFIGSIEQNSQLAMMWNIALDGNGNPKLPGTGSCSAGCRAIVTVNSDGSYFLNQEFYAMAQASRGILPRDQGGPTGQRIQVTTSGPLSDTLKVGAYVTGRTNPQDWLRYSLVVLNRNDNVGGRWNPQPVTTTIRFRGKQAQFVFPVGMTTLWWYAPKTG